MTVKQLLASLDADELTEWMAYDRIDPVGSYRGDVQAGVIASTIANVNRRKGAPPFKPLDFMPFSQDERKRAEGKALSEKIKAQLSKLKRTKE